MLAALLLPALRNAKISAQRTHAINNLKQLHLAWTMYTDDNGGKIPPQGLQYASGEWQPTWVAGWLDYSSHSDNINTDYLINFGKTGKYGHLGQYLENPAVFRSPADKSQVRIFGKLRNRVRSVSMNEYFDPQHFDPEGWQGQRNYRRISDIRNPGMTFTFIEEREDSINNGVFFVVMDAERIGDYPAAHYNGAGVLVFAAGNAETKRWLDPRTTPRLTRNEDGQPKILPYNIPSPGNLDMDWLRERTAEPK